jgi:hypothetical protein
VVEFHGSIRTNESFIPNYSDRHRYGEVISTAFVEPTVNQVISKRFVKKQQMRWTKTDRGYYTAAMPCTGAAVHAHCQVESLAAGVGGFGRGHSPTARLRSGARASAASTAVSNCPVVNGFSRIWHCQACSWRCRARSRGRSAEHTITGRAAVACSCRSRQSRSQPASYHSRWRSSSSRSGRSAWMCRRASLAV